jgi:predicted transcriptional regulator
MKTQILDHLNLVGQATVAEIATQLNFNATSVSTIMSRLHRDGCVSKRGGGGTRPSLYTRSSNSLKQLEAQFEHPNADTEVDIALLKQEKLSEDISAKVINEGESDHSSDHFPKTDPRHIYMFEQGQDPCPETVSSSNSEMASLSKSEPSDTQNTDTPVTGDTKKPDAFEWVYWGKADTVVQVISTRGEWATVRLPGKRQTDKVLISELGKK